MYMRRLDMILLKQLNKASNVLESEFENLFLGWRLVNYLSLLFHCCCSLGQVE